MAIIIGTVIEMILPEGTEEELGDKIIETNSTKYDLLFKNATNETSGAYWLSSLGIDEFDGRAGFGPSAVYIVGGMSRAGGGYYPFGSGGTVIDRGLGLCPVVSLESGVLEKDVPKLDTAPTEPEWSMPIG